MSATKQGARDHKPVETTITAAEAVQLLESAVNYCQKVGLTVNYANDNAQGLTLYLPGCKVLMDSTVARFVLESVTL